MKTTKPWIGSDGKPLSDEVLKQVSKHWTRETWEEYLQTLERAPREEEVLVGNFKKFEEMSATSWRDILSNPNPPSDALYDDVREAIEALPDRQKYIIEESIYLGKGQREIAKSLGLSRTPLRKSLKSAKKKLAQKLSKHCPR